MFLLTTHFAPFLTDRHTSAVVLSFSVTFSRGVEQLLLPHPQEKITSVLLNALSTLCLYWWDEV